MSPNKVEKLKKTLGNLTIEDLDKMPEHELKGRIVQANGSMKEVEDQLEANEKYQQLKSDKAAMEQGKKDVDKRQKAIIKYCLHRMEEIGKDPGLNLQLEKARIKELQEKVQKELDARGVEAEVEVKGA